MKETGERVVVIFEEITGSTRSRCGRRLNMIHHLLSSIPYEDVPREEKVTLPKRPPSTGYKRPPIEVSSYVPDWASTLVEDPARAKGKGDK